MHNYGVSEMRKLDVIVKREKCFCVYCHVDGEFVTNKKQYN